MAGATITTASYNDRVCSFSSPPIGGGLLLNCNNNSNSNRVFLSTNLTSSFTLSASKHHKKYHQIVTASSSQLSSSSSQQDKDNNNINTLTSSSTKLYVSGLSFRTSEESLRTAFQSFGQLIEVNLVMDKIANRSRGFAFLRYATKEESDKAIEGIHGKFLDGRVIFVEFAKPRSQLNQGIKQGSKPYR